MSSERYLKVEHNRLFGFSVISTLDSHTVKAYDGQSYEQLLSAINENDLARRWKGEEIVLKSISAPEGRCIPLTSRELKTLRGDLARARPDLSFILEGADV